MPELTDITVPSRIVHLPLSWDDPQAKLAQEKYTQAVRPDAPWCPSNIEFIRRINGLESVEEVHRIVYAASYLVLGLGDVYLGAPVATPVDPRHRLVTTKYKPREDVDAGECGWHRRRLYVRLRYGGAGRVSACRPHDSGVEHMEVDAGLCVGNAVVVTVLRSDPVLSGVG